MTHHAFVGPDTSDVFPMAHRGRLAKFLERQAELAGHSLYVTAHDATGLEEFVEDRQRTDGAATRDWFRSALRQALVDNGKAAWTPPQ
ncbi:MAG TPA: hypothetical protein VEY95_13525 [Azospirillaceae bacterium]|nr:hypothetical protein [Azospirillaceae bacterium]